MALYEQGGPSRWHEAGTCVALALAGAVGIAAGQFIVEFGTFHAFNWMERRGLMRRFAPSVPFKVTSYSWQNFWAVAGSHVPLFLLLAALRRGFVERARPSLDPLAIWPFIWATMVLHDGWFFAVHSVMHKYKGLYRAFHQLHHTTTSDLNAFATSYAEASEFLMDWSAFYAMLLCYMYTQPTWNPVAVALTLVPVAMVNVMGHSGFDLPVWVYAPLSFGVLLTPGAQEGKIHFIHHIDPRFNRSLYFTWWDRLFGTYRDTHGLLNREATKLTASGAPGSVSDEEDSAISGSGRPPPPPLIHKSE